MARKYLITYHDNIKALRLLSDAERGRLYLALLEYSMKDEDYQGGNRQYENPKLSGNERFMFEVMKAQIDRDNEKYRKICDKNRSNGANGGRPRKSDVTDEENIEDLEDINVIGGGNAKPKKPSGFFGLEKNPEKPKETHKNKNKKKKKNKNVYLTTFDIHNNTQENLTCECVSATTNDDIVSLFNKICSNLPKVTKLSKKRTQLLAKLFKSGYTQQEFKQVFEMANNSDFLCGKTANSTFRANFDWVLNENNFIKILEGNYANLGNKNLSGEVNRERKPSYDIDEHRRDCQNALMRSRSSGIFLETLKE